MVKIANQLVTFLVTPAWTILKSTIHPLFSIGNFRTNQATIYLHRNVPPRKSSGKGVPRSWRPSHNQHFAGWLEPALCWTTWRKGGSKSSPTAYRCSRALNLLLTQHWCRRSQQAGPSPAQWHLHRGSPPPSTTGQPTDLPRVNPRRPVQIGCPGIRAGGAFQQRNCHLHSTTGKSTSTICSRAFPRGHGPWTCEPLVCPSSPCSPPCLCFQPAYRQPHSHHQRGWGSATHQRHHHPQPSSPHTLPAGIHHLLGFRLDLWPPIVLHIWMFGKKNRTDVMQKKVRGTKKNKFYFEKYCNFGGF